MVLVSLFRIFHRGSLGASGSKEGELGSGVFIEWCERIKFAPFNGRAQISPFRVPRCSLAILRQVKKTLPGFIVLVSRTLRCLCEQARRTEEYTKLALEGVAKLLQLLQKGGGVDFLTRLDSPADNTANGGIPVGDQTIVDNKAR